LVLHFCCYHSSTVKLHPHFRWCVVCDPASLSTPRCTPPSSYLTPKFATITNISIIFVFFSFTTTTTA
jgi:hypothetical protein